MLEKIYNSKMRRNLLENHSHTSVRRHKAIVKAMALPQTLVSWTSTLLDILDHIKSYQSKKTAIIPIPLTDFCFLFPFSCFFSIVKYFSFLISSHSMFQSTLCLLKVKHSIVNVLNATDLCTLKWPILCCVNFTTVKKVRLFSPPVLIEQNQLISTYTLSSLLTQVLLKFQYGNMTFEGFCLASPNFCSQFPMNMYILLSWKRLPTQCLLFPPAYLLLTF